MKILPIYWCCCRGMGSSNSKLIWYQGSSSINNLSNPCLAKVSSKRVRCWRGRREWDLWILSCRVNSSPLISFRIPKVNLMIPWTLKAIQAVGPQGRINSCLSSTTVASKQAVLKIRIVKWVFGTIRILTRGALEQTNIKLRWSCSREWLPRKARETTNKIATIPWRAPVISSRNQEVLRIRPSRHRVLSKKASSSIHKRTKRTLPQSHTQIHNSASEISTSKKRTQRKSKNKNPWASTETSPTTRSTKMIQVACTGLDQDQGSSRRTNPGISLHLSRKMMVSYPTMTAKQRSPTKSMIQWGLHLLLRKQIKTEL